MSEGTVFQSIENVLIRIEEIKRRFGVRGNSSSFNINSSFEQELERAKVQEAEVEVQGISDHKNTTTDDGALYKEIIETAAEKYRIPEPLIRAVIKQESNFNQGAVSNKGAMGLMQLMPATADLLGVDDPLNAEENILGGSKYLRELINLYKGNLNRALAAYNAGPGQVNEGIPNIQETKNFIKSVLRYYNSYSKFKNEEGL